MQPLFTDIEFKFFQNMMQKMVTVKFVLVRCHLEKKSVEYPASLRIFVTMGDTYLLMNINISQYIYQDVLFNGICISICYKIPE